MLKFNMQRVIVWMFCLKRIHNKTCSKSVSNCSGRYLATLIIMQFFNVFSPIFSLYCVCSNIFCVAFLLHNIISRQIIRYVNKKTADVWCYMKWAFEIQSMTEQIRNGKNAIQVIRYSKIFIHFHGPILIWKKVIGYLSFQCGTEFFSSYFAEAFSQPKLDQMPSLWMI